MGRKGRRALATAVALSVLILGALTGWWTHEDAERRTVAAAAVAGYVAAHPGARAGVVSRQDEQDGYALVSVTVASDSAGIVHLVAQRQGDWWIYLGQSAQDLDGNPPPEACEPGSDLLRSR